MKLVRPFLALSLGAALVVAGSAQAKVVAKPVCNLVTDPAGDAPFTDTSGIDDRVPTVGVGPSNDVLDVLSADIATDKKNLTAVIRVKKLAKTAPTTFPTGLRWDFQFTADGNIFTLTAATDATGAEKYFASYEDALTGQGNLYGGGASGAFDLAENEVHISVPVDLLAEQATIKAGAKITDLEAQGGGILIIPEPTKKVYASGSVGTLNPAAEDIATSTKTYIAGAKSCVTPGK